MRTAPRTSTRSPAPSRGIQTVPGSRSSALQRPEHPGPDASENDHILEGVPRPRQQDELPQRIANRPGEDADRVENGIRECPPRPDDGARQQASPPDYGGQSVVSRAPLDQSLPREADVVRNQLTAGLA